MRIVIALGGNALGNTPKEQKDNTDLLAKSILPIIKDGHEVIFTHGNGPQVGLINLAFIEGNKVNSKVCDMPFPECGSMSQGYIGYHLQNSLYNTLRLEGINNDVVSIITQVLVDINDPAFSNPTKPIGSFYTKEEAEKLPYVTKEDGGRGYRRVVASPKPVSIIEKDTIISLLNDKKVVIGVGGGGIPVVYKDHKLVGVDAVIDKDLSSAKLAIDINADRLLILTAISNVKINYNTPSEISLTHVKLNEIEKYYNDNHFREGSMKPKVLACMNFLNNTNNTKAIITSIENAYEALKENKGTIIEK